MQNNSEKKRRVRIVLTADFPTAENLPEALAGMDITIISTHRTFPYHGRPMLDIVADVDADTLERLSKLPWVDDIFVDELRPISFG